MKTRSSGTHRWQPVSLWCADVAGSYAAARALSKLFSGAIHIWWEQIKGYMSSAYQSAKKLFHSPRLTANCHIDFRQEGSSEAYHSLPPKNEMLSLWAHLMHLDFYNSSVFWCISHISCARCHVAECHDEFCLWVKLQFHSSEAVERC